MIILDHSECTWKSLSGLISYVIDKDITFSKTILEDNIFMIMRRKLYQYDM